MRCLFPRIAVATAFTASLATALIVAPESPCSKFCGNTLSSTSPDEMVCTEGGYTGTSFGVVYQNCVNCEAKSTFAAEKGGTDLQYMLCESNQLKV